MLTRTLTALVLAATPQVPAPPCTLAGPQVEARWSSAIPPASTAEAPMRAVADIPLPGSASRFDYQSLEPAAGRLFISHMGAEPARGGPASPRRGRPAPQPAPPPPGARKTHRGGLAARSLARPRQDVA